MEEDEMDSSLPRVSLPSDKELEETQNVKVTFIRVLPIRPPSPEDSRLPSPSAPPTTSQGVSEVECMAKSCPPFLARRNNLSIYLIEEMLQLMTDRVPDLLVARPNIPGGQICRSQSAMNLLAQEMLAKISAILKSDPDILQAAQSKAGLQSVTAEVILTIKNILAGKTTVHQEEQRLAGVQLPREDMIPLAASRPVTPELEVDEIRQGVSAIMDPSLISRRPEIKDSILYRSLCMDSSLPQRASDGVKITMIFLEPEPQTLPTAQPSQADEESVRTGPLQRALRTLRRLRPPQVVPVLVNTSGADLDQKTDQEPHNRPLLVRMFRALKKSISKTFCCLGDIDMVKQ